MEKNVTVGIIMEREKIVYQNNGFIITEHPRKRDYNIKEINDKDKIYRLKIIGTNQPTIDDICNLVFFILRNKVLDNPFYEYKDKILDAINKAEYERFYPDEDKSRYYKSV
jgi:hypothetical protein